MTRLPRVFVTRDWPSPALRRLAELTECDFWSGAEPPSPERLRARVAGCEGLLCLLTDRVDSTVLEEGSALRVVSSCSVGVDHVDLAAATRRGIPVGHTPGVLVETTADLAFALLLAAARRVPEADRFVRDGSWVPARRWEPDMLLGRDLDGATLGLVGLGAIGRAVARRAQGFGLRVLGWTRSGRAVPGVEPRRSLDALLEESEFLSLHVAATPETRHLIDERALGRLPRGAVLVNTARGDVVDQAALVRALGDGRVGAAGLDVFEVEPLEPDSPLRAMPQVVLTPHIGSASVRTRERMAERAVENLLAGLEGRRLPHCANPEVYARSGGGGAALGEEAPG